MMLSSSSSAFFLNGSPGAGIAHCRGLRQNDPLLSLLFILAIDPLNGLIAKAANLGILATLLVRDVKLRVSLYTDNADIFANPVHEEIDTLLEILQLFSQASGLCINPAKSSVAPIRCEEINLTEVLLIFGGTTVAFLVK